MTIEETVPVWKSEPPTKTDLPIDEFKRISQEKQAAYEASQAEWRKLNPAQNYEPKGD